MNLRQKSALVMFGISIALVGVLSVAVYSISMVKFQDVEDQRVERNIRIVSYVLKDRFKQINAKVADWAIWDDTYTYLEDHNSEFEASNLSKETFVQLGVDEAIFIDRDGKLVSSFLAKEEKVNNSLSVDSLYTMFSNNSLLTTVDGITGYKAGIVKVSQSLVLYVVRDVYRSDGSGPAGGKIIFTRNFDGEIIDEMKDLTQFNVNYIYWNDPSIPTDFSNFMTEYQNGNKQLVKTFNDQIDAGYLAIEDSFGVPQAIIRVDVVRDITSQGRSTIQVLLFTLFGAGLLISIINYWLINEVVLKKVLLISNEVGLISGSGKIIKRLAVGNGIDEVDSLRTKINELLDSIQTTQMAIEKSSNHVIITDAEGVILFANEAAQKLTGYSLNMMVGKTPRLWGKQMDPDFYKKMWETIKVKKQTFKGELINKRQNGELYTAMATITPVLGDTGDLKGFVAIEEDITERKKSESEIKESLDKLERLNKLMVGRELKMIELKKEIDSLKNAN